jgi:hypothetical protein
MATIDRTEINMGGCPCGRGVVTSWEETPDHPWVRRPSAGGVSISCGDCSQRFATVSAGAAEDSPEPDLAWNYVVLVHRADVEERETVRHREKVADLAVRRIQSALIRAAVERLKKLPLPPRYGAAAELFGFGSFDEARSFARRRHVETWAEEAARDRIRAVASHLGQLMALDNALEAHDAALKESERLGLPDSICSPNPICDCRGR